MNPLWDIETLVKEPDDPALRGYSPGHPWYYFLGGRPLLVEEISTGEDDADDYDYLAIERLPNNPEKRNHALLRLKDRVEQELARDIRRYKEIVNLGKEALSSFDIKMGYGLETALSLTVSHVSYDKRKLAQIEANLKNGKQKMLFV